jgi:hypothetical protein
MIPADVIVPEFLPSSRNKKHVLNMQAFVSGVHNFTKIYTPQR